MNLLTIPAHPWCNKSYQSDEDYFFQSLAPLAHDSPVGQDLFKDMRRRYQRPEGKRLYRMVRMEFDFRPGGLYLPRGIVLKRFDGKRIMRVVWKITRGLFFHHAQRFLPEYTPANFLGIGPRDGLPKPDDELYFQLKTYGEHPDIFAYSFIHVSEENENFHGWYLRFWESFLFRVLFHDPECSCDLCAQTRDEYGETARV